MEFYINYFVSSKRIYFMGKSGEQRHSWFHDKRFMKTHRIDLVDDSSQYLEKSNDKYLLVKRPLNREVDLK